MPHPMHPRTPAVFDCLKPDQTPVTQSEWHEMTSRVFAYDWSAVNLASNG